MWIVVWKKETWVAGSDGTLSSLWTKWATYRSLPGRWSRMLHQPYCVSIDIYLIRDRRQGQYCYPPGKRTLNRMETLICHVNQIMVRKVELKPSVCNGISVQLSTRTVCTGKIESITLDRSTEGSIPSAVCGVWVSWVPLANAGTTLVAVRMRRCKQHLSAPMIPIATTPQSKASRRVLFSMDMAVVVAWLVLLSYLRVFAEWLMLMLYSE